MCNSDTMHQLDTALLLKAARLPHAVIGRMQDIVASGTTATVWTRPSILLRIGCRRRCIYLRSIQLLCQLLSRPQLRGTERAGLSTGRLTHHLGVAVGQGSRSWKICVRLD